MTNLKGNHLIFNQKYSHQNDQSNWFESKSHKCLIVLMSKVPQQMAGKDATVSEGDVWTLVHWAIQILSHHIFLYFLFDFECVNKICCQIQSFETRKKFFWTWSPHLNMNAIDQPRIRASFGLSDFAWPIVQITKLFGPLPTAGYITINGG